MASATNNICLQKTLVYCQLQIIETQEILPKSATFTCGIELDSSLPRVVRLATTKIPKTVVSGNKLTWMNRKVETLAVKTPNDPSWNPRKEIFKLAQTDPVGILSISLEPTNPTVKQPIFIESIRFRDEGLEADTSAESIEAKDIQEERIEAKEVAPLLRGFLKPFKEYTSEKMGPEVDPASCPSFVEQIAVSRYEEIAPQIEDIQPAGVKERVQQLVFQFLSDPHARKMYVKILQPAHTPQSPIKYKLFIKP